MAHPFFQVVFLGLGGIISTKWAVVACGHTLLCDPSAGTSSSQSKVVPTGSILAGMSKPAGRDGDGCGVRATPDIGAQSTTTWRWAFVWVDDTTNLFFFEEVVFAH